MLIHTKTVNIPNLELSFSLYPCIRYTRNLGIQLCMWERVGGRNQSDRVVCSETYERLSFIQQDCGSMSELCTNTTHGVLALQLQHIHVWCVNEWHKSHRSAYTRHVCTCAEFSAFVLVPHTWRSIDNVFGGIRADFQTIVSSGWHFDLDAILRLHFVRMYVCQPRSNINDYETVIQHDHHHPPKCSCLLHCSTVLFPFPTTTDFEFVMDKQKPSMRLANTFQSVSCGGG